MRGLHRACWLGWVAVGLMAGCKPPMPDCAAVPLVDTVGRADERDREELQWLRISGKLDSAQRDPEVRKRLERSVRSLDSSASRYRDSLSVREGILGSVSGCVDWNSTLRSERVDRQGLLTAWVRALVDTHAVALEWSISDTARKDTSRVRVLYQVPGENGGSLDSTEFEVGSRHVRR